MSIKNMLGVAVVVVTGVVVLQTLSIEAEDAKYSRTASESEARQAETAVRRVLKHPLEATFIRSTRIHPDGSACGVVLARDWGHRGAFDNGTGPYSWTPAFHVSGDGVVTMDTSDKPGGRAVRDLCDKLDRPKPKRPS